MGAVVGFFPDSVNLGFVAETERQVSMHLESHLQKIAAKDLRSRAILSQMYKDEQRHGARAFEGGGKALPIPLRWVMKAMSKVMTTTAFWV